MLCMGTVVPCFLHRLLSPYGAGNMVEDNAVVFFLVQKCLLPLERACLVRIASTFSLLQVENKLS